MNRWKKVALCAGISVWGIFGGIMPAHVAQAAIVETVLPVSVITKVYGDGEKPAYAVITYPKVIDGTQLVVSDFRIAGQTIEDVETNSVPEPTDVSVPGRYVLLKLAHVNSVYDGDLKQKPDHREGDGKNGPEANGAGGNHDAPLHSDRQLPDFALIVQQLSDIKASDGTLLTAKLKEVAKTSIAEPEIKRFQQITYTDPNTGYQIPYNLYLPKDYDSRKKYPLLFFVADASANINAATTPLFQGNGATVWTDAAEQAKHPCIVMAPQYTEDLVNQLGSLTNDKNVWSPGLTLMTHALENVIQNYAVDTNRIYGTGQSQGGMANIAISDKYPNLFAAQWLVACQWDTEEMKVIKDKNLWITVCEGDEKAFPGMNEAVAKWEALGTKVAKNSKFWDSKAMVEDIDVAVRELTRQNFNINYTIFAGGNHMYTWSFAYDIDAIRDWLFVQTKDGTAITPDWKKGHAVGKKDMNRGLRYYTGNGVPVDYVKAKACFEQADSQGEMKAARYLGLMYENGDGVTKNYKTAVQWYRKAADEGDITGSCLLGQMYERGMGLQRDYAKALQLYKKSAERGDIIAAPGMVAIGNVYEKGLGVKVDLVRAKFWYEKAASTGYKPAQKIV